MSDFPYCFQIWILERTGLVWSVVTNTYSRRGLRFFWKRIISQPHINRSRLSVFRQNLRSQTTEAKFNYTERVFKPSRIVARCLSKSDYWRSNEAEPVLPMLYLLPKTCHGTHRFCKPTTPAMKRRLPAFWQSFHWQPLSYTFCYRPKVKLRSKTSHLKA